MHIQIMVAYVMVGVLWGCTNPFIKHAQENMNSSTDQSTLKTLQRFFFEPNLFLPFLINQSGSMFYYFLVSAQPISIVSPICNSLSFIFTAITSYCYFGEDLQSPFLLILGILLVLLGSYICISG